MLTGAENGKRPRDLRLPLVKTSDLQFETALPAVPSIRNREGESIMSLTSTGDGRILTW